MRPAGLAAFAGALALSACVSEPMGGPLKLETGAESPVSALQTINGAAAKCWFASGERSFRDLRMVPELDTTTGTPRLLIVRAGKAQGLPVLVIEASGAPVTLETYGPLAATATGGRVNRDIMRWSSGPARC